MSLDDRDWWREDHRKKEELYGGDFSLNSKPIYKPLRDDTFTDTVNTLKPKSNSGNATNIDVLSALLARHCRSVDKYAWLNVLLITFIIMMVIVFDFLSIFALLS